MTNPATPTPTDLPEALRLADALNRIIDDYDLYGDGEDDLAKAAAELRRQHAALSAAAPAVAPAMAEKLSQPWYDLAWKHGATSNASYAGDELTSLEFTPAQFDAFCAELTAPTTEQSSEVAQAGLPMSQEPKYTVTRTHIVNRASGEAVPHDEPVFVFRARDALGVRALEAYLVLIGEREPSSMHADAVRGRIADFQRFASAHPDRMKWPDTATAPKAGAESYPPLPRPAWDKRTICTTGDAYSDRQMRAYADATAALRARGAVPSDKEVDRILDTQVPGGSSARDWFMAHHHERGLRNVREVVRRMLATWADLRDRGVVPTSSITDVATAKMIAAAEEVEDLYKRGTPETWGKVWRAMLAAAPQAPAPTSEQAGARLPQGAEAVGDDGWPKLTAEAKTAGPTFGKGVSARLLVEACYRRAAMETERREMTQDAMRDEERRRRALWDLVHGPLDAATPASGGEAPAEGDAIRALIERHAAELEGNESAYFELCYHRVTGWMAWVTDKPLCMPPVINPDRKVLLTGQGDSPDEACRDALAAKSQKGAA